MGHDHAAHPGFKQVVNIPGIGGGFKHHLISRFEVFVDPGLEATEINAAWRQHHFLGRINSRYH